MFVQKKDGAILVRHKRMGDKLITPSLLRPNFSFPFTIVNLYEFKIFITFTIYIFLVMYFLTICLPDFVFVAAMMDATVRNCENI